MERLTKAVIRIGLSQKWRMLRNRVYKNRIMFIHVPRSGGTSFFHVMRALYCLSFFKLDQEASRAAAPDLSGGQWMPFKRHLAVYHIAKEIHRVDVMMEAMRLRGVGLLRNRISYGGFPVSMAKASIALGSRPTSAGWPSTPSKMGSS